MNKAFSTAYANSLLLNSKPKRIVISGPSGFLGSRVLQFILKSQMYKSENGADPGEVILLSSSPGNLMQRLYAKYGPNMMKHARASRVDYYTQHDVDTWTNQLGSLGAGGDNSVFVNLAAVAGPMAGRPSAMDDVNYRAPVAAAKACERLGFGHWIQSSTQATNAERAGQVPYSRAKAMCDFALSRMASLPVTITVLGLLYCRQDGMIGQRGDGLNLIDLALLPLTPILGDGTAPLQPLEISDAAERIAFLALTDTTIRPPQTVSSKLYDIQPQVRVYDGVGPETVSMMEMLRNFAKYQGNNSFRPVYIDYRNMERILNVKSLGNLNRQFVSLLRSEQDSVNPIIGNPEAFTRILGPDASLWSLETAFAANRKKSSRTGQEYFKMRKFPYVTTMKWIWNNPRVIPPGISLTFEILSSFLTRSGPKSLPNKVAPLGNA